MSEQELMEGLQWALGEFKERRRDYRIVILTGAGISRESGLATFRDYGGLWNEYRIEDVATPEAYLRNPGLVHTFYNMRRREVIKAAPNAAHAAMAELEGHLGDRLTLVTQNVDDLHERAGTRQLIHMHGEVLKVRCIRNEHIMDWHEDADAATRCPHCQAAVRPHIVWFGEMPFDMGKIDEALDAADVFCAIGTSGTVYPAAGFVHRAREMGALCIEVNLEPSGGPFDLRLIGPATVQVPRLVGTLVRD